MAADHALLASGRADFVKGLELSMMQILGPKEM